MKVTPKELAKIQKLAVKDRLMPMMGNLDTESYIQILCKIVVQQNERIHDLERDAIIGAVGD